MKKQTQFIRQSAGRPGFSLVEAAISTLLVGTLLVAATRSVSMSVQGQRRMADRARAAWLADDLAAEILQQSYREPGTTTSNIGRDAGESFTSRSAYDDVDDYHGWNMTPPRNKDGTTLPDLTGWSRAVTVEWVSAGNVGTVSGSETGVKRARITVSFGSVAILTRTIIKTAGE